ncbi:MAG: BREX system Lon protease-like protein BrxL, partial [Thermodesulfobacteriota bacterium]
CINKSLMQRLGFERNIPSYVGEWIIDRFCPDGELNESKRKKIKDFINQHLPSKNQREVLRNRLLNGETLTILDDFSVYVDLKSNRRNLKIPSVDIEDAYIERQIVDDSPLLLCGGLWGAGRLSYHYGDDNGESQIWLIDFKPMQISKIDIDYYSETRSYFSLSEWRDLLINSMGYNPEVYTPSQQMWLLTRLIPVIQNRVNLIELSPKGTGKSWVYINLSRYIRIVSGGKVTPAVLFYNNATNIPGLLVRHDVVVLDECQSISFENPGEVVGILKGFLEAGFFTRGKQKVTSEASLAMLANIPISHDEKPINENLFENLPRFLGETAFIDRIHGVLPGWELPKIDSDMVSNNIGFKADFFAEVLHILRDRAGYLEYIKSNCDIKSDSIRDKNAIWRLAAGYLKLLFPDLKISKEDLYEYCLKPALNLRQRIRGQLALLDPEYKDSTIEVEL